MLKEFLDYIINQSIKPSERIIEVENQSFVINDRGEGEFVKPLIQKSDSPIKIHTLSGIVNYIKNTKEVRDSENYIINIKDESNVELLREMDLEGKRDIRIKSTAISTDFEYSSFMTMEKLNIELQSKFVSNEDKEVLLKVSGNVQEENVSNYSDDGVSQSVSMKNGVSTVAKVIVPNPVVLAPFRTFTEVEQPESKFIFRMESGPKGALFESDGGHWRNEAIKNIKDYFEAELKDEVSIGFVYIIA